MARYIDADRFAKQAYEVAYPIVHDINSHERGLTLMGIAQLLDEQPTADVVPRERFDRVMDNLKAVLEERNVRENVKGEWEVIDYAEPRRYGCSNCHIFGWHKTNYCPNCGAEMRGEA